MSSSSTSTPLPQADNAPVATAPGTPTSTPSPSASLRARIRNLGPLAKGVIVAVLVLIVVAWYVFSGRVTTDDAQVDCHITAIAPQVPGYVVQLLINDNTPVKEGDLLVQIDPREYQAEVEQAKASFDFAEAQANSAKLQIRLTRETTTNGTNGASAQNQSHAAQNPMSQAQLTQCATYDR